MAKNMTIVLVEEEKNDEGYMVLRNGSFLVHCAKCFCTLLFFLWLFSCLLSHLPIFTRMTQPTIQSVLDAIAALELSIEMHEAQTTSRWPPKDAASLSQQEAEFKKQHHLLQDQLVAQQMADAERQRYRSVLEDHNVARFQQLQRPTF